MKMQDIIELQRTVKRLREHPVLGPIYKSALKMENSAIASEQASEQMRDKAASRYADEGRKAHETLLAALVELESKLGG